MNQDECNNQSPERTSVGLRREIGLVSAVNFLLSYIIGSATFVTPGEVLAECGSVGMTLTIWVLCGVNAFLTCLPFGELGTVIPKSGSMYTYLHIAFSSYHPFFGALPAFIFFWVSYVIIGPTMQAVNAILFAEYFFIILQTFVSEEFLANEYVVKSTLGTLSLVVITVINCVSVKLYVKSQDLLTYLKMGAIVFTIGCGFYLFVSGKSKRINPGFEGTHYSTQGLVQAVYFCLFTYDGGWLITGITEELKNPNKNILYSIVISLIITTAAYILLNIAFLTALTTDQIAHGTTTISDFSRELFGPSGEILAAGIICLCLLSCILCFTFFISRLGYVAAREGHMIEILCYIDKTRETPTPALILQTLLSLLFFFLGGDITIIINIYSFFISMSYLATMIALFVLRVKFPEAHRPYRVPSAIAVIVAAVSFCLVVVSALVTPPSVLIAFGGYVTLIVVVYYIFVYKAYRIKNLDIMQNKLQTVMNLVPPSDLKL